MKIWKAILVLFNNKNEEYEVDFNFELQEKDYNLNKSFDEWTHLNGWAVDRIPVNMIVERQYDNYKIVQGFDHELNETELKQLEKDMRDLMRKQLNYDKELYLKKYEEKLGKI